MRDCDGSKQNAADPRRVRQRKRKGGSQMLPPQKANLKNRRVIPGRCEASNRNLEIPGLILRIIPE
jgi:hypothetical protein